MNTAGPENPANAAVTALLAQLREALSRRDLAAAENLARQVLAEQPAHEQTLAYLANHARQQGDLRQARAWVDEGLRRRPGSVLLR